MPRFMIERDIPEIGSAARDELRAAAAKSNEVLAAMKRNRVLKSVYSLSVISSINGIPKTSVPNCGISTMPVYIRVKVYVYSR